MMGSWVLRLQVFIAMAVFLGDGLYNFAKIAVISMLAIKNDVQQKKPKQAREEVELSPPSAADAAAEPKAAALELPQVFESRAAVAGQQLQAPDRPEGTPRQQREEPASPNSEAALLKQLRDQMFLHEAVPW